MATSARHRPSASRRKAFGAPARGRRRRRWRSSAASIVALLGPSGSGKTTLLRMIAGFERPDAGAFAIGGRAVAGPGVVGRARAAPHRHGLPAGRAVPAPDRRPATSASAPPRQERAARVPRRSSASPRRAGAYPHELSGGERQRVALARALAADPEVVLLDEPFAALDAGLRETLREEVAAILRAAGATALLVTHDQAEALSLADRVAVLRDGRIEQVGTPEEVYERPGIALGRRVPRRGRRAAGHRAPTASAECELGRFAVAAELSGPVDIVVRPESVAIGHGGRAPHGAEARRRRALVLRPRPARQRRAAQRAAPAQPPARLPGLAPGRPRAGLGRRAGQRAGRRASARAGRHRAVERPGRRRRTPARRRRRCRCGRAAAPARARGARRWRRPRAPPRSVHSVAGAEVAVDVAPLRAPASRVPA